MPTPQSRVSLAFSVAISAASKTAASITVPAELCLLPFFLSSRRSILR